MANINFEIEIDDSSSSSWSNNNSDDDSSYNIPVRMQLPQNKFKEENKKLKLENQTLKLENERLVKQFTKLHKKHQQVKKVNHKIITRFNIVENNFKNESCGICLETKGDKIVTYCGHLFHDICLKQWGKKKGCPMCRGKCETSLFKIAAKPITKVVGYKNELKIE